MKNNDTMALLAVLATPLLIIAMGLYHAWAAAMLWAWFMVPLGLPAISIGPMWGVILTVAFIFPKGATRIDIAKAYRSSDIEALAAEVIRPLLVVAIGWCVHGWIS